MIAVFDLAARDPSAAFAELRRSFPDGAPDEMQARLAASIFERDFTKAPEILPQISKRAMRGAFGLAIPKLYARDGAATITVILDKLPDEAKADAMYRLIEVQLAAGDMTGAMRIQLEMPKSDWRLQALAEIAGKSGSSNLESALNWMGELTDDRERELAHVLIIDNLRGGDDGGLLRLLAVTPVDEPSESDGARLWNRRNLIRRIVSIQQSRNDSAALIHLRGSVSVEEQPEVDSVLIARDETLPPAPRIAWLWQLANPHARNYGIWLVVGEEWKNNPQQAMELVLSLPEETFGAAFRAITNEWEDKAALSEWIKALPPGFQREQAINNFAGALQYSHGDEKDLARKVATWAADPSKREELQRSLSR